MSIISHGTDKLRQKFNINQVKLVLKQELHVFCMNIHNGFSFFMI